MTYENILKIIDARGLCKLKIEFKEDYFTVKAFSTKTCLTYVLKYAYTGRQLSCELA